MNIDIPLAILTSTFVNLSITDARRTSIVGALTSTLVNLSITLARRTSTVGAHDYTRHIHVRFPLI